MWCRDFRDRIGIVASGFRVMNWFAFFANGHSERGNGAAATAAPPRIEIGDHFRKIGFNEAIWIVERRFNPGCQSLPHVVLRRKDCDSDKRVVSETILLDRAHYRPDRRAH